MTLRQHCEVQAPQHTYSSSSETAHLQLASRHCMWLSVCCNIVATRPQEQRFLMSGHKSAEHGPAAEAGRLRPAEAGRAPGSTGSPALAEVIICLEAATPGALASDTCCTGLEGNAAAAASTGAWRRADPGRPDDVPGLASPPEGVCGRPGRQQHSLSGYTCLNKDCNVNACTLLLCSSIAGKTA